VTGPLETALVLGKPLRYRVRRSPRARRIGVQVCRREGVVVVLPRRAPLREAAAALERWAEWLDRQVEKHGVRHGPRRVELAGGSTLLVLGEPRILDLRPLPAGRTRARITLADDAVVAELPQRDLLDPRPALERWLRRLARTELEARTAHWAETLDLHPRKVIVGERTSRWGSCSRRGTLSFCYRLVLAPPRVIDAIVAHEVCHLAHFDHSPRFWALLDSACPWHRDASAWLAGREDELIL
jgi:predicted metal-dependent hydrolase